MYACEYPDMKCFKPAAATSVTLDWCPKAIEVKSLGFCDYTQGEFSPPVQRSAAVNRFDSCFRGKLFCSCVLPGPSHQSSRWKFRRLHWADVLSVYIFFLSSTAAAEEQLLRTLALAKKLPVKAADSGDLATNSLKALCGETKVKDGGKFSECVAPPIVAPLAIVLFFHVLCCFQVVQCFLLLCAKYAGVTIIV